MNTEHPTNLAPVFLDNQPVSLKDPRPKVSAVLTAQGKPDATEVKWLQFQPNTQGKALRNEEVLDRTTDPTRPIYLTSAVRGHSGTRLGATPSATRAEGADSRHAEGSNPRRSEGFGGGSRDDSGNANAKRTGTGKPSSEGAEGTDEEGDDDTDDNEASGDGRRGDKASGE